MEPQQYCEARTMWLTALLTRMLGYARRALPPPRPQHLQFGRRGEVQAYRYLRRLGYRIVDMNVRVPFCRGEIDLVGWDDGVLCFIEVKSRSSDVFAPPSTAVDREKKRHILEVARRYLRRLGRERRPPCRFDIVSVVPFANGGAPRITLRKGAFSWDAVRPRSYQRKQWGRYYGGQHFWRRR